MRVSRPEKFSSAFIAWTTSTALNPAANQIGKQNHHVARSRSHAITCRGQAKMVRSPKIADPTEIEYLEIIGRGSFGVVYKIRYKGQLYALKKMARSAAY